MAQKVILVVDKDQEITRTAAKALDSDYQVLYAPSGDKTVALPEKKHCHLIIISHCLPNKEALQALTELAGQFPNVPLISIAENASTDFVIRVFRSGARDFL